MRSVGQIFVNRSLQISKIKCIGFDMDATLAIYNSPEVEVFTFDLLKKHLVYEMGYPLAVRRLVYNPAFPIRGIWFDRQLGFFLKTDECSNIVAAWSGLHRLSNTEIREVYPNKHLRNDDDRIMIWTTIFHLPEIALLAGVMEFFNITEKRERTGYRLDDEKYLHFRTIQADVRKAMDSIHENGLFKARIVADLPRYIAQEPRAVAMLRTLSNGGKSIFLLTNSSYHFTDALMQHVAGAYWRDLFDVVIVEGNKPNWFTGSASFKEVDLNTGRKQLGNHVGPLRKGAVYAGGNATIFREEMKCVGKDLLYVGDHIIGDILVSKHITGWRTLLIVPELDREMMTWQTQQEKILEIKRNFILENDQPAEERQKLQCIKQLTDDMERSYGIMGSILRCGWRTTHYGGKIRRYADLYTSNAYNLLSYAMDHYFYAPMVIMPHEAEEECDTMIYLDTSNNLLI